MSHEHNDLTYKELLAAQLDNSVKQKAYTTTKEPTTAPLCARDPDDSNDIMTDEADATEDFREKISKIKNGLGDRYDPSVESLPKLAAYHPSFAKVETYCTEIFEGASTLLKGSGFQDTETLELLKRARDGQNIQYPAARRIGLIGDSGVGKSALINSLLDTPEIALSAANGEAVTCVVTEYQQPFPSQKTPFMAEVTILPTQTIKCILYYHFQAYYIHKIESQKDREDREKPDELMLEEQEGKFKTADDAFKALFANRDEFSNAQATEEFFKDATSAKDATILNKLWQWTAEAILGSGAKDGIIRRTADEPGELMDQIEHCVKTCTTVKDTDDCPTPSLWPIVEIVKVGLRSPLLERGLIFADLPGLSDINRMRTSIAARYIRTCHFILLVAPIGRVKTNSLVRQWLARSYNMVKHRKALVCTQIDALPTNTKPSDYDPTSEAAEEYESLLAARSYTNTEKARLQKLRKNAKGKARGDLRDAIENLILDQKIYSTLLREVLISMRNSKIGQFMVNEYQSMVSDSVSLPFFAVSNTEYERHKEGFDPDVVSPPISVEMTGIPNLRFFMSRMPAKSKLDVLEFHCWQILGSLINRLDSWSNKALDSRHSELKEVVAKPRASVEMEVARYVSKLKSLLQDLILAKIKESQDTWVETGKRTYKNWESQWHPATFACWCRNKGAHRTQKQSYYSWNQDLLAPVATDLEKVWGTFDDEVVLAGNECVVSLVALLDTVRDDLSGIEGVSVEPMAPFLASLELQKGQLRKVLEGFTKKLRRMSENIKLEVTMEDESQDAFLMEAMSPVYEKCGSIRGKNGHQIRRTLLEDSISKGEPFSRIFPGVEKAIEDGIDKLQPAIIKQVQRVFDDVVGDFDLLFVVEEEADEGRDNLRERTQEFVRWAKAKMYGPMQKELSIAKLQSDPK